jgi:hypothetical protein
MNERNVPEFNREGIERVLWIIEQNPNHLLSLDQRDIKIISKAIMQYAESCGIIRPQSPLK